MADIKVADEIWIANALLHREQPYRRSFQPREILERAKEEALHSPARRGLQWHVYLHCVANRAPNGADYRMLYETPDGGRRLFQTGDDSHPSRGGKIIPDRMEIPEQYRYLIDWYRSDYERGARQ